MQWFFAIPYKISQTKHPWISRVLSFLISTISCLGIFLVSKQLFKNKTICSLSAFLLALAPSFYYYGVCPMPDNMALALAILGVASTLLWRRKNSSAYFYLGNIMFGLAALVKLPFVIYFIFPVVLIWHTKQQLSGKQIIVSFLTVLFSVFPALLWYTLAIPDWDGNPVTKGVFSQIDIERYAEFFFSNLSSTLPELILGYASVAFFLVGLWRTWKHRSSKLVQAFGILAIVLIGYVLFELNLIAKIHDYYLFPLYPLVILIATFGLDYLWTKAGRYGKSFAILCLILLPITTSLRMQIRWQPDRLGFNSDLLTYKSQLRAAVPQDALCIAGSDQSSFIFFYYIDKKGWNFYDPTYVVTWLPSMIDEGAQFLYTDRPELAAHPAVEPLLDGLVLRAGSIEVFRLCQ